MPHSVQRRGLPRLLKDLLVFVLDGDDLNVVQLLEFAGSCSYRKLAISLFEKADKQADCFVKPA